MPSRLTRAVAPSLKGRLSLLLIAVLCLGAALAGWLIWQGYRNERQAMERHLGDTARSLATLMETELGKREALLRGLSVSSHLATGNLNAFDQQARQTVVEPGEWIVLVNADRQQLVNTLAPPGLPLPVLPPRAEYQSMLREGRTYISNLETGPVSGGAVLFVAMPVKTENSRPLVLALAMTPARFTHELLNHRIGEGWLIAVVDREMVIAGRNRNAESFIGKKASPSMIERMKARPEGVAETVTLDGVPSITAFCRAPRSGWTVIVAAPRSELFQGAQKLAAQALVVAIAVGALAIFFSVWIGRTVVGGMRALVSDTETLARGQPLESRETGIKEIDLVSRAIASTSAVLAAREAALAHARDEALAASRAKDEFLAALSHELRTPLNPVLLLASDGANDPALPTPVRDTFAVISRNVSIESRLIDDLLDLTRIGSGKLSLHLQTLSLDRLLAETLETLRRSIDEKPLTLHLDLRGADALIAGDFTRLQQVFLNLLNNAIKFTPARGRIDVSSRIEPAAGQIVVTIADSGLGMTAAELARLFQRFAQGDHAAHSGNSGYGGLGLGLVIARTLVDMHHGEISASSPGRDQGSTFTVRLPLTGQNQKSPPETIAAETLPQPPQDSFAAKVSTRRILLVEDHKPTLATLEKLLTRRGYEIVSANTAALALEKAAGQKFDLVISDIGLPDRTGYELMRELGERHGLKGIAVSGYGADADRAQGKAAGFILHLTKPVNIASLDEALQRLFTPTTPGEEPRS
jgi:signal transduction histidine kinase/ActR/RegA family two-component response regulator